MSQRLPDLTRNCKQCGIEFIASNKSQEYCSLDCKHTIPCEICGELLSQRLEQLAHLSVASQKEENLFREVRC